MQSFETVYWLIVKVCNHASLSCVYVRVCLCVLSETQGHENPVFLGGSPETKTRTVSQIMTRQSSETGRHLLSEPGTPFSPPAHGDVFFPAEGRTPPPPLKKQIKLYRYRSQFCNKNLYT